jgi:hypothetical protein
VAGWVWSEVCVRDPRPLLLTAHARHAPAGSPQGAPDAGPRSSSTPVQPIHHQSFAPLTKQSHAAGLVHADVVYGSSGAPRLQPLRRQAKANLGAKRASHARLGRLADGVRPIGVSGTGCNRAHKEEREAGAAGVSMRDGHGGRGGGQETHARAGARGMAGLSPTIPTSSRGVSTSFGGLSAKPN